mmetsp:Transcript_33108/g.92744  ORF Transcript_33108/g.92744 Transcript_33108/m.92744 type:complete len:283 (+) Transcript_33108:104-952(+)|eukprot:CAMPEP_0119121358 /NCGR_PEP_ID=MMETSP1310-20130426/2031_1 /TAXON_ID=464262 /ORGANISM="Genus nov. species nov., Strain RCC2339" /LENGTH=282 /DNA_ID=CAMNT_0007110921 /DNA_START=80 /DNA_END=928 /DNA_ORIENTATION=+
MSSLPGGYPHFPLDLQESDLHGLRQSTGGPFIIGVCGASASGKTSVCEKILDQFKFNKNVEILSLDCFYKELDDEQLKVAANGDYDFDHPSAFEWPLLVKTLKNLKSRPPRPVSVPEYDFCTHRRAPSTSSLYGVDILLLEGIMTFFDEEVRGMMDLKIFVETDSDVCLSRRIKRDIENRGRDLKGILIQYERFVKPAFDQFIQPQKKYADLVLPLGAENVVAIDLLVNRIRSRLEECNVYHNVSGRTGLAGGSPISKFPTSQRLRRDHTSSESHLFHSVGM